VILYPYDPDWPRLFADLRTVIYTGTSLRPFVMHHVGSTAIPGMIAKPIIDMDLVIPNYEVLPQISSELERLGYTNNGDQGIADRLAFKPRDDEVPYCFPRRKWGLHHLYICPAFSQELDRHLVFRDYLRLHQEARDAYSRIKKQIEAESNDDKKAYALAKETRARAFVKGILKKART
jgi:GrpB-like predicted nucleotidyltransferase (UPF0157 family)